VPNLLEEAPDDRRLLFCVTPSRVTNCAFVATLQFAWSSSKEGLKMKKMSFIAAGLVGFTFVSLSANRTGAMPFGRTLTLVLDTSVTSIAHHCWRRPSGKLDCAYRNYDDRSPYYRSYGDYPTYGYGDYRFHYHPYGYYPAYQYRAERPYLFHEFYLPNEYDHPGGLYDGPVFYYRGVW
jgi:hypothetical protein